MSAPRQVAFIGDVGGHAAPLRQLLAELPPGAHPVLLGDLVHRGPDSSAVLDLVEHLGPAGVTALTGNHESLYGPGVHGWWPTPLSAPDAARVERWRATGQLKVAAAVTAADGEELLATHAGLTEPTWRRLGSPGDAHTAADALNALDPADPLLHAHGAMLTGVSSLSAGPLWASAAEVAVSWASAIGRSCEAMPFSQVHGHSSLFWYSRRKWSPSLPGWLRPAASVDVQRRQVSVRLPGGRLVGTDPCHGAAPAPAWTPLLLEVGRFTR